MANGAAELLDEEAGTELLDEDFFFEDDFFEDDLEFLLGLAPPLPLLFWLGFLPLPLGVEEWPL